MGIRSLIKNNSWNNLTRLHLCLCEIRISGEGAKILRARWPNISVSNDNHDHSNLYKGYLHDSTAVENRFSFSADEIDYNKFSCPPYTKHDEY